jgi:hypothetical protein
MPQFGGLRKRAGLNQCKKIFNPLDFHMSLLDSSSGKVVLVEYAGM